MYNYKSLCLGLWMAGAGMLHAQELLNPFDFPILLSGNFGELRSNHFHAGLDFKTQGVEGKPVHAVKEGYVARIVVSPWGYGNALYLNHPDGTTTVYGHLQRFAAALAAYVKEQQYEQESFGIDLRLQPEQFPVRQGQTIALAGNSGSSAGPHLHFEVRETETGILHDPLEYFKDQIKDSRPPEIGGFMIYPLEGKGVVNGSKWKKELKLGLDKNGRKTINETIEAWGEIGVAVKAYDYMDGTSNIYGVRRIAMAVDSQVIFSSHLDYFPPEETRYINSFIDYEAWKEQRSFYMKTFVEPGNRLRFIKSINKGVIRIDEERTYRIAFRLRDLYGNMAQYTLSVLGRRQDIPAPETAGEYFHWKGENRFAARGIRLFIPSGNLYNDLYFSYELQESTMYLSGIHVLHHTLVPLHDKARLALRLDVDTLADKQKYGLVRLENKRAIWIGGTYARNGWIESDIRDLGAYTIMQDLRPPVITAVNPATWRSNRLIRIRISDDLSGVHTYRGEIDGRFALFELDGKKGVATYHFDSSRLSPGSHTLNFTVTDACGNRSEYKHSFIW
jgi:murein DD-endopeptidase MepM/ murein hydrolase activator NlpD